MLAQRAILILTAVVLATAAPLRAWCEADCLAPAAHSENASSASHCQTTEDDSDTTSMSATIIADCPTVESARPVAVSKPVVAPVPAPAHPSTLAPSHARTLAPKHARTPAPSHPRTPTPLRV